MGMKHRVITSTILTILDIGRFCESTGSRAAASIGSPQTAEEGAIGAARDSGWQPDSQAVHYQHIPPPSQKEEEGIKWSDQAK